MTNRKPGRPPGIPNPNGGRPLKGAARRKEKSINFDPAILALVEGHARARMQSISESVNMLLLEALRNHEYDSDNKEVY